MGARWIVITCALTLGACSVLNDVDVCDRRSPGDREANVLTEGAQAIHGRGALATLPNEGALLAFLSSPPGDYAIRRGIRVSLLTAQGEPIRTCDAPGGGGLDVVSLADDGDMLRYYPFLATAARIEDTHLLVWSEIPAWPEPGEVRALGLYSTGCVRQPSFAISDSPDWIPNIAQAVRTGENEYTIIWTESFWDDALEVVTMSRVMGRVVSLLGGVEFLGTVHSVAGDPAVLTDLGSPVRVGVARIDDDRFAVATLDGLRDEVVGLYVLDDRLAVQDSYDVMRVSGGGMPTDASVDVVWTGERLLVLWTQLEDDRLIAWARWVRPGVGPEGPSFRIGAPGAGEQLELSGAAMGDGRVFVVWEERNGTGRTDGDGGGIRALMLDRTGDVQFADPACGRGDFQLNTTTSGNQWNPAVTVLDDGTIVTAFTDDSGVGVDRSESGVRTRVFKQADLLPVQ